MTDTDGGKTASEPLELDIPAGVAEATQSVELVRAWIADGKLMVSLNADAFDDQPGQWGRLLSELAEHAAKSAALKGVMAESEAEALIRQTFTQAGLVTPSQPRRSATEGVIRRTRH